MARDKPLDADKETPTPYWTPRSASTEAKAEHRRRHYTPILIRRQDYARLRQLEHEWHRTRVDVVSALLDQVEGSKRLVPASEEAWARLDDLAFRLKLSREALIARVLELASQCSLAQLLKLLNP